MSEPRLPARLDPLDRADLVAGYVRHSRSLRVNASDAVWDPADPDTAAFEALERAVRGGPAHVAWHAVVELLRSVPDDELPHFAAGPLEDLVRLRAPELAARVEAEAARDPRFRRALGCIWLAEGDMPPDVLSRIVAASGGAIRPLPRERR